MPPRRARRHPRLPAPGLLCRDPARQTSTRPPGRRASATGGACARGAHGLLDQANGRQIGPSSGITAARWHARRPFPPSGAAIPRHFAPVPPSPWGHRILQIPITSPEPRGFVHGRFPYAGPMPHHRLDGRRPKTFTMSDARGRSSPYPGADIRSFGFAGQDGREADVGSTSTAACSASARGRGFEFRSLAQSLWRISSPSSVWSSKRRGRSGSDFAPEFGIR